MSDEIGTNLDMAGGGGLSNPDVQDFIIIEQAISAQAHSGSVLWVFQTNECVGEFM